MNSLEMLKQRGEGLAAKLTTLREHERAFQRVAGLQEQQERDRAGAKELGEKAAELKKTLADLADQKAKAMQGTATAVAEAMNAMLPYGTAVFTVDDEGSVFLGWDIPGHGAIAHGGLSGGQRVMFESALAYALAQKNQQNPVILVEGAELGPEIGLLLERIAETNPEAQIVACTCHPVTEVPEGWTMVAVS